MAVERPLRDLCYIVPIEETTSSGGLIYIPETARQLVDQGIVKYVGPDVKEVKRGDHVFFSGHFGTRMAIEDEGVLIIIREIDLIAVANDDVASKMFSLEDIKTKVGEGLTQLQLTGAIDQALRERAQEYINNVFETAFVAEGLMF